ncbi:MAG: O-antigen ligase family protein [Gemmatimonadales bacterium]
MTVPKWAGAGTAHMSSTLGQSGSHPWMVRPISVRSWLVYPVLIVIFALMGPYSLHPAAAEAGGGQGVAAASAVTAEGVQSGSAVRRMALLGLAAVAALSLSRARRSRGYALHEIRAGEAVAGTTRRRGILPFLLLIYVALAGGSLLWAADPGITGRRAVVFLIIVFAAFCFAQAWTLRDLLYFSLCANATSLILGLGGAIARGQFQPFAPGYRFSGFANPNLHGIEAACLIIACAAALRLGGRRGPLYGLLLYGAAILLLSRSRTAVAALVLAAAFCGALAIRRSRLVAVALVVAGIAFAAVVFAPDILTGAHHALLLGRSAAAEDPTTLSGRTLLWNDLLDYAGDHPWLGYGFDSFWTPDHIAEISVKRGWVITQAHSGYLEALLATGITGLTILIATLFSGLRAAIRRFRATHATVVLFAVAMFVWYMVNMLLEALPESHVSTFVIMILLAHFALRSAAPDDVGGLHASG